MFNLLISLISISNSYQRSAFVCSLKNIIVPMRLSEKRGKQSQLVESRGGPSVAISTEKYDRYHMGYTQKVTSFSRTYVRRHSQETDFPALAYRPILGLA